MGGEGIPDPAQMHIGSTLKEEAEVAAQKVFRDPSWACRERTADIKAQAELKLADDVKGIKGLLELICLGRVASVSLGPVTTQQVCCDETGSRSRQEIEPTGQDQRGRDWALTQLQHSCSVAQAEAKCKSLSLKAAPKGWRGRQALLRLSLALFPTNSSDQQKGWPWTQSHKLWTN